MFAVLAGIFGFLRSNITPIIIGVGLIALSTLGLKLYGTIYENGQLKETNKTLLTTINTKNTVIKSLQQNIKLRDDIVVERDKEIEKLKSDKDLLENLGKDATDQTADSIKEFLRRKKNGK